MKAAFIIPVRNRRADTEAILQQLIPQIAVREHDAADFGIFVADDGSEDGTPELIRRKFPQVHLLRGTGDWWWTGAIAHGMSLVLTQTDAQYLIWLNDDLQLASDFIENLQKVFSTPQFQAAIIGGIVRDRAHPDWLIFSGLVQGQPVRQIQQFAEHDWLLADTLNGNIVVIPRTLATQLGLPDTQRFPHYGGDYEYTERAKKAGFSLYLVASLQAEADYQVTDVIRYMPVWMQWYLAPNWPAKRKIFRALRSRKFHHNIYHIVNRMYLHKKRVAGWRYEWFYFKKICQCLWSLTLSGQQARSRFRDYFAKQNIPPHLCREIEALLPMKS
jgi:glycosyltransferase involved in cell wall biosynthesis